MSDQSGTPSVSEPVGSTPVNEAGQPLSTIQQIGQTVATGVGATLEAAVPVAGGLLGNSDTTVAKAQDVVADATAMANAKIAGDHVVPARDKFLSDLEELGFDEVKDALAHLVAFKGTLGGTMGLKSFFTHIGQAVGNLIPKL